MTVEHAPQRLGAAQPAAFGHHVERVVARFEVGACRLEPHTLHEPSRALADLGGEHAGEMAHAHGRRGGEHGQPVVTAGRGLDPVLDGPDGRTLRPGHPDRRGELGLAARPVQEHDQPPGQRLGDVGAQVLGDHGQGRSAAHRCHPHQVPAAPAQRRGNVPGADEHLMRPHHVDRLHPVERDKDHGQLAHGTHSRRDPPMASTTRSPHTRPQPRSPNATSALHLEDHN